MAFDDFLTLAGHFGQDSASYIDGNIDLEDGVSFADFLVLSNNFGKSATGIAAVPEPSGCLAMVLGASILSVRRRRRPR